NVCAFSLSHPRSPLMNKEHKPIMLTIAAKLQSRLLEYGGRVVLNIDELSAADMEGLLQHGVYQNGSGARLRPGMAKHCYDNAQDLVVDGREAVYMEGFALDQ